MTIIGENTDIQVNADQETSENLGSSLDDMAQLGLDVSGPQELVDHVGSAEVFSGVYIAGLVHISKDNISEFTREGIGQNGKFGKGTHFAAGKLEGETFDALIRPGMSLHECSFSGTIMVLDRSSIKSVAAEMRTRAGLTEPRFKNNTGNADLLGLVEQQAAEHPIDAVVVFMDENRQSAEFVVAPHANDKIEINSVKTI